MDLFLSSLDYVSAYYERQMGTFVVVPPDMFVRVVCVDDRGCDSRHLEMFANSEMLRGWTRETHMHHS